IKSTLATAVRSAGNFARGAHRARFGARSGRPLAHLLVGPVTWPLVSSLPRVGRVVNGHSPFVLGVLEDVLGHARRLVCELVELAGAAARVAFPLLDLPQAIEVAEKPPRNRVQLSVRRSHSLKIVPIGT